MARMRIDGVVQFQRAQDATRAERWLTDFLASAQGQQLVVKVKGNPGPGYTMTTLNPPHPEGCTRELRFAYILRSTSIGTLRTIAAQLEEGVYKIGDCSSTMGASELSAEPGG
jgi:hypothetical protein